MSDDGYPEDETTIIVEFADYLWSGDEFLPDAWRLPKGASWRVDDDGWLFVTFNQDQRDHRVGYPPHRIHRVVEVGRVGGEPF